MQRSSTICGCTTYGLHWLHTCICRTLYENLKLHFLKFLLRSLQHHMIHPPRRGGGIMCRALFFLDQCPHRRCGHLFFNVDQPSAQWVYHVRPDQNLWAPILCAAATFLSPCLGFASIVCSGWPQWCPLYVLNSYSKFAYLPRPPCRLCPS